MLRRAARRDAGRLASEGERDALLRDVGGRAHGLGKGELRLVERQLLILARSEREQEGGRTRRLRLWMYLRDVSSFKTCATLLLKIFSRPERSWMPTMVTPIGQGALPIERRR